MSSQLFSRSTGSTGPQSLKRAESSRLLQSLGLVPAICFDGKDGPSTTGNSEKKTLCAHQAGVNCLAVDRFEGRYMISGGAEASIKLWNLEATDLIQEPQVIQPLATVNKSKISHKYGVTHVSFYPFDSMAFLSSSYDHKLKIYATETMDASGTFDLGSVVYSHSVSAIADHLLVACATQHSAVRLVDLRSGASTHSLTGHHRAVISVAWSPHGEYILASGSLDGTVRLWDIRRSTSSLGVLDLEDSIGIIGEDGLGKNARAREQGKAHNGAVNGVVWTDDGKHLVTAGHDERVRTWDMATGANSLSHFGPIIKNSHLSTLLPLLVPIYLAEQGKQVMFYPNGKEILMFDLFNGTLLKRLRIPNSNVARGHGTGQANFKGRTTSLVWKTGDIGIYSAHSDGAIRAWLPSAQDDGDAEENDTSEARDDDNDRKRKRHVLDKVFRELTKQKITFT